jgi:hypothetical protein
LLHAILEGLPSEDDLASSKGGALALHSQGVQLGDVHHPSRDYAGASDRTDETAVDRYTNTPPRATDGSPGGTTTRIVE